MDKITPRRKGEYLSMVLKVLIEKGGSAPAKEVISLAEEKLNLTPFEKELTPKNQNERWWAILQLYSIDMVKAGWLRKNKAVWYITEEGRSAASMEPEKLIKEATRLYRAWKEAVEPGDEQKEEAEGDAIVEPLSYEQSFLRAKEEIKSYVSNLNPYDFQDLVAALLRGMGYYTPFVAPKGPDGGIDIIAYKDPLGVESPRIRVQVKHQGGAVGSPDIQKLLGVLQNDGYVGVFVSAGGFSKEAQKEARAARHHVETIDLDRFIELWEQFYEKMNEEDQSLLPIRKIAFLAPED